MSNDVDNDYFCDGITEEIINALTKIRELKVIARTSSFVFKGKQIDVRKVGKQLNVATILEGSVRKANNRVRITAQLIDTEDGSHYWSKKFDRELSDIFELQDDISMRIANEVRNNFGHFDIQEHLVDTVTNNIDAYQLFLKGRSFQLKWTPESLNQAISCYNQAIALDKNYAKAYYANLQCYGLLAMWGYMPHEEAMELAVSNLLIAKEIDTKLPEYPLSFVGKFFWGEWDFKNAYLHINQVLDINPNHIDGLEAMAELCIALGFFEHSKIYADKLLEVDPLSANNHYTLAHIYYYQGQFKKALECVSYALHLNPELDLAHHLQCFCYIWLGKKKELLQTIEAKPLYDEKRLLYQVINEGNDTIPEALIATWSGLRGNTNQLIPYELYILANSSHKELAFQILKEKINHRRGQVINHRQEPFLIPLRELRGFKDLHQSNLSITDLKPLKGTEKNTSKVLDVEQVKDLKEALLSFFEEEAPYLDPQLNLKYVAEVLEQNTNKISYVINEAFGVNFNDFVNAYRLKHFKTLALEPKNAHITILGLAYDSGFNSKSVFNTYFKKTEGLTPRAWLTNHTV